MDAASLDYDLPPAAIAQVPAEPRDSARLMVDRGDGSATEHRTVADLPDMLEAGDILVVNDSRVIPARLNLHKPTGGAVEVLLLERRPEGWWEGLVRPSRRVSNGTVLTHEHDADLTVTVGAPVGSDGRRRIDVHGGSEAAGTGDGPGGGEPSEMSLLERSGKIPLPPYIHEPLADPERYQTVYADRPGSVAAPTAGLHLTPDVLDRCRERGVTVARVELVVGLGTFRPITADRVEDHPMHAERYRIPPETTDLLTRHLAGRRNGRAAADGGGRVVAVGTTVVRTLETWAATGETEGSTDLFIHGDAYPFGAVDRLLTNFHVPRSSLLALLEAFTGPRWRDLYRLGVSDGYRFLSFGDAMLVDRRADDEVPR